MGHRLSKIITRTGDDGTTGLGQGARISKDAPRIEVIGEIDLLNSQIGLAAAHLGQVDPMQGLRADLHQIQNDLFDLGGGLSIPGSMLMREAQVAWLETRAEQMNAALPALKEFILPGGGMAGAALHVARATARSAERRLVGLREGEGACEEAALFAEGLRYLNRLSDFLFIAARYANAVSEMKETLWRKGQV